MKSSQVADFNAPLKEVDQPTPQPAGTQVLIKVKAAGVCHSDLHIWEGGYDLGHGRKPLSLRDRGVSLPRTMGHETVGEVVAFGSFFLGAAILHSHVPVSLSDHNVTRAVVGSGLYLTVLGLFSLAIGAIIRHTAGAITTAIGVVFVLPILSGLLPGSWGAHINGYLPVQAGELIGQANPPAGGNVLSAWQGFGVFCLWTVVLLVIAGFLLQRRDA